MSGGVSKLAKLRAKKKAETSAKVEAQSIAPTRTPVTLFCGHFDWDFDAGSGACRLCKTRGQTTRSGLALGVLSELSYHVEKLGESLRDAGTQATEALSRLEAIEEALQRVEPRLGFGEVFDAYPGLGETMDRAKRPQQEEEDHG